MQHVVVQFNQDQLALVRNTVAKNTTPDEFKLFIEVCRYHGLNPFARQIYAVIRNGKSGRQMTIQTSIDGYRLLAERSGKYAGQVGPEWCGDDGVWRDVWLADKPPAAARIGVLRKDFNQPTWGVAKYKSYAQSSPLWEKMPDTMLAKCAESLALRKAFPAEMSGIYTKEEMEQADHDLPTVDPLNTVDADQTHNGEPTPSEQQIASIRKLCHHLSKTVEIPQTFAAAKALIAELTKEYRQSRENSVAPAPEEMTPTPLDKIPVVSQLHKQCDELFAPGKWDEVQAKLFEGQTFSDEEMTPERCQRMHRSFEIVRERRAGQQSVEAKAS